MKTLSLPIILVSGVAMVGITELLWLVANNSLTTLSLRFSHSFFTLFTLIPLSMIGVGIAALALLFRKKYVSRIRYQIIFFGTMVIIAGLGTFSLYLVD